MSLISIFIDTNNYFSNDIKSVHAILMDKSYQTDPQQIDSPVLRCECCSVYEALNKPDKVQSTTLNQNEQE